MPVPKIDKLSPEELQELMSSAAERLTEIKESQKSDAKQQCIAIAEGIGETVESLFGWQTQLNLGGKSNSPRGRTTKSAPKYRNPNDADQTWTGRGRKPKWFQHMTIVEGVDPEDLLIK